MPTNYVCWWLSDLRFLSSNSMPGSAITHLNVQWSNRLQLNMAKTEILRQLKSPTSTTATSSAPSRTYWLRDAVCCSPRPRNYSRPRHVDEFPRQKDSVNMFRCAEAANSFHSPLSHWWRHLSSVVRTRHWRKHRYSSTFSSALQSVMNAAARLIYSSSRFGHITPLLRQLHWLNGLTSNSQ